MAGQQIPCVCPECGAALLVTGRADGGQAYLQCSACAQLLAIASDDAGDTFIALADERGETAAPDRRAGS